MNQGQGTLATFYVNFLQFMIKLQLLLFTAGLQGSCCVQLLLVGTNTTFRALIYHIVLLFWKRAIAEKHVSFFHIDNKIFFFSLYKEWNLYSFIMAYCICLQNHSFITCAQYVLNM